MLNYQERINALLICTQNTIQVHGSIKVTTYLLPELKDLLKSLIKFFLLCFNQRTKGFTVNRCGLRAQQRREDHIKDQRRLDSYLDGHKVDVLLFGRKLERKCIG